MERVRASVAVALVLGTLSAAPMATAAARANQGPGAKRELTVLPSLDSAVVARVNAIRASRGLRRLTVATGLAAAAGLHTRQMARTGLFQHESPDGSPFWQRVRRYYGATGFRGWSVGETLVWQSPAATASQVVTAWLESPEHRHILLDPSWHEIGVGAVQDPSAPGDFDGLAATIVTADFGVRSR